jgi:hypothetical protein
MAQALRNFICKYPNCNTAVQFDISEIKKPGMNTIKCPNCGKEWKTTITSSCCSVNIRFVSLENGSNRPITVFQSFIKPR